METIITEKWNFYLEKFSDCQKDIYYYEEYVRLYETETAKARCVICWEDGKMVLFPFICQEIDDYFDLETAYGYGGPIVNNKDTKWIIKAIKEMGECLRKNNYLCGFLRFHSLIENVRNCNGVFDTYFDRNTVCIDTSMSEEEIWKCQITSKNRNMIRKAEKNGLVYAAEYSFKSINEFIELYNNTMKRLGAETFYYFERDYYDAFINNLKGKAFLGTVRKDGKLISAALFMYSAKYGHYHLAGSDYEFSSIGANNLLLWRTALELHDLGIEQFHLGGGSDNLPDNSLLKFKKSFGNHIMEYYIGKWIFNEKKYNEIKEKWMKNNPEKVEKYGQLLLCYRY